MKLKMHQVLDFPAFFEIVKAQKISFKTSYRLAMLAHEIEKHHNFYTEEFRKLLQECGEKDSEGNLIPTADGNGIKLQQDKTEECYTKLNELRELEVELPDCYFDLEDFDGIELTPMEVNVIIPFIKK